MIAGCSREDNKFLCFFSSFFWVIVGHLTWWTFATELQENNKNFLEFYTEKHSFSTLLSR